MDRYVSIQLDKHSEKPLYIQIYEGLVKLIEDGTVKPGEKLPPIRRMASLFNVNTVTVVNAYKQLEYIRYVESRVGSGTYVCFKPVKCENYENNEDIMGFQEEVIHVKYDKPIRFDFASASISPRYFPIRHFKQIINEVIERDGGYALEYQESSGFQSLRKSLKSFMQIQHDLTVPFSEIQIVSGAQQGIDILAKAFLNYGDIVYVEAPTYPGAINAFKSRDAKIVEIDILEDGIDMKVLRRKIKETPQNFFTPCLFFKIPPAILIASKKRRSL